MRKELRISKNGDGYVYIDKNGASYDSVREYIQTEILGICGCGIPDGIMKYIYDFLLRLKNGLHGDYEDLHYMFLCYWADDKGYTDHGSTIRLSNLSDKGKEILEDIEWCIENELNN